MVDTKKLKEVSATFTATAASAGSFPAPVADGAPQVLTVSSVGVQWVTFASDDGSVTLSVVADQDPAPTFPVGFFVEGIFRATLPTYTDGDAVVPHFDSRGRLLVSPGETGLTADVDTDQAAGPATPVGIYQIGKREATLPSYADGENSVFHFDSRGRLIVTSVDLASGAEVSISTEDSAGPTNPVGEFPLGLYRTTLPTYTDGDAANFHFSVGGRLLTSDVGVTSGTGTTSTVAASAANVTLLAANTSRLGATIFNDSASETLHVKLGATASLTDYTTQVGPDGYYEVPFGYTGIIDGIWTAAVGDARITELT